MKGGIFLGDSQPLNQFKFNNYSLILQDKTLYKRQKKSRSRQR
jgi:hypothetical protein